jgi:hypothetical protein
MSKGGWHPKLDKPCWTFRRITLGIRATLPAASAMLASPLPFHRKKGEKLTRRRGLEAQGKSLSASSPA